MNLGHVEIWVPAVRTGSGGPISHVFRRGATAIDVGSKGHIAQAGQHARTFLLIVIHASPILDNNNCWTLVAGSAMAGIVCQVSVASGCVARVVVHGRGKHVVFWATFSCRQTHEEFKQEEFRAFPGSIVSTMVIHRLPRESSTPFREAVVDILAVANDLIGCTRSLKFLLQQSNICCGIIVNSRM